MSIILILPNQLFENNELIKDNSMIYLYEEPIFFTKFKFHKLKLILHRSTMKCYYDYLKSNYDNHINYIEYNENLKYILGKHKNKKLVLYDPVDFDIIKNLKKICKDLNIELFVKDSPLFLTKLNELLQYKKENEKFHQMTFYIWQRKRLNILLNKNKKPIGGKWTFDKENRLPFPDNFNDNKKLEINNNKYVEEAKNYINKNFANNPGEDELYLPINFKDSKKHLDKFLKQKLNCFGPYQDAVSKNIIIGCHSVLSPLLNIGLITPFYVINKVIDYYEKHKNNINFSSVEGFIRQIIGWRESIHYIYMFHHTELIKANHFNHTRKLEKEWYTADTGIEIIDDIIKKILKYAYAHHIERLMYLSNFMLLAKFDPKEIYKWFISLVAIDSYQWVMEPNVYAMGQYSTGPLMMNRPYFSSSNYISKMSSYKKKPNLYKKIKLNDDEYEWYEIWDALYYNFINDNLKDFSKNYSTARSVSHWNKKSGKEKNKLLNLSKKYINIY